MEASRLLGTPGGDNAMMDQSTVMREKGPELVERMQQIPEQVACDGGAVHSDVRGWQQDGVQHHSGHDGVQELIWSIRVRLLFLLLLVCQGLSQHASHRLRPSQHTSHTTRITQTETESTHNTQTETEATLHTHHTD